MILDPSAIRIEDVNAGNMGLMSFVPAIVDIASAFFGALYFLMSAKYVKSFPICLLILLMNVHSWLINSILAVSADSSVVIFSTDIETGCLGFLNFNQNLLVLFMYAVFCSFFGSAGNILCLLFYSPMLTANSYLLEPFFA